MRVIFVLQHLDEAEKNLCQEFSVDGLAQDIRHEPDKFAHFLK